MYTKWNNISKEEIQERANQCKSLACLIRSFGLVVAGGNFAHMKQIIAEKNIDISHFTGKAHVDKGAILKDLEDYTRLTDNAKQHIKDKVDNCCERCGLSDEWMGEKLVLHIHHIDGNNFNNNEDNLQVLCPNCHSQTDSYVTRKSAMKTES